MTAPQCWKLGSTTVREPTRLLGALIALGKTTKGLPWGAEAQRRFACGLIDNKVYSPKATLSDLDLEKIGRTWISPLSQFGFVHASADDTVRILPPGLAWLNGERATLIWLRQLLKFQIPNPTSEFASKKYHAYGLRPFLLLLRALHQSQHYGQSLTKSEIANSILTCLTFSEFEERSSNDPIWFKGADSVPHPTLRTYADLTIRYASMSGLIAYSSDGGSCASENLTLTESLIKEFWHLYSDEEYQTMLPNSTSPPIEVHGPRGYYGGIKPEVLQMFEASIESLRLAIFGLGIPQTRVINEDLAATAPQLGLIGAAFELALGGVLLQVDGEAALRRDSQMYKTSSEIFAMFRDALSRRPEELGFLTMGMENDLEHLLELRSSSDLLAMLPKIRARALHAGRGLPYDVTVTLARNAAEFIRLLFASSCLTALMPYIPFPTNIVKERTLIVDEISARLKRTSTREDQYDMLLSAIYLVLPEIPNDAPDWLSGMEKLAISPGESDIAYALHVLENASPATFIKVRPSSESALPVRFSRNEGSIPIAPEHLGLAITDLKGKIRAQLGLAKGKIESNEKFVGPLIERKALYQLFANGLDWLNEGLDTRLTAQELSILVVSALCVQGTEAPYYFLLNHSDDLGQLTSQVNRAAQLGPTSLNEKVARLAVEIGNLKNRKALGGPNIDNIKDQLAKRQQSKVKLATKISEKALTLPDILLKILADTVHDVCSLSEAVEASLEAMISTDKDKVIRCLNHLCRLPPDHSAARGYLKVLETESLSSLYTETRKGLRVLDYVQASGDGN